MMTLFWMFLGVLMAAAVCFVYLKLHVPGKMSVGSWVMAVISILWGVFTLAWAASSVAENEMQAAGMGLLIFGFILVIFVAITRKLIISKNKQKNTSVQTAVNENS